MGSCHACGAELPGDLPIFRETECPRCSQPLKVCLNCTFYEKGLQWDCRESIAEPVRDKERANFCDYFRLREGPGDQAGEQAGGLPPAARRTGARLLRQVIRLIHYELLTGHSNHLQSRAAF